MKMKKRLLCTVIAMLLLSTLIIAPAYAAQPSLWAVTEVNEAIALGIVPSALQNQYTASITRAEFCELIIRMLTVKQAKTIEAILRDNNTQITNAFNDTTDRNVLAANALGIVTGTGDRIFAPSRGITRQEAAVILVRAASLLGTVPMTAGTTAFSDRAQIASWAANAVAIATSALKDSTNNMTLIVSTGNNMFSPQGNYTREQAIMTAKRLHNAFSSGAASSNSNAFVFPYSFSTQDLYGNTVTEASLGEKEVFFVHYWATWCPPCVSEMPDLAKVAERYGDRVGFIALLDDFSSAKATAIRLTESSGVSFINVDANHSEFRTLLRLVQSGYVPTTVLIDRDGRVIGEQIIGAHGSGYGRFIDNALSR